jgi:hypothetical protein
MPVASVVSGCYLAALGWSRDPGPPLGALDLGEHAAGGVAVRRCPIKAWAAAER